MNYFSLSYVLDLFCILLVISMQTCKEASTPLGAVIYDNLERVSHELMIVFNSKLNTVHLYTLILESQPV